MDVYSYYYKDANGALCSWEGVEKQTGAPGSKSSKTTMCTIAVLKRQIRCDCLLLVRQYRAPVGKYTIEFPATVVDGQGNIDHVVEAANREIQDETGYTSTTFKHISPDTAMDAGKQIHFACFLFACKLFRNFETLLKLFSIISTRCDRRQS